MLKSIKNNPVTTTVFILAFITVLFVPVDKEYINYFDIKTLGSLFCILVVVQCLKNSNFFQMISKKTVYLFKNIRSIVLALIVLTFICDLFLANDMSLITLLPLTYIVLESTNNMKYFAFTMILQTIAANMSGMITPHGNPQNLYLYSYYNIPTLEFIKTLLPQFLLVLFLLILLPIIFVKKEPLKLNYDDKISFNKTKIVIYLFMFLLSLLVIFRAAPLTIGIVIIVILAFILDKKALVMMDWDLLLTFCLFFIFSGNISRITSISDFLKSLLDKNVLITGIVSCQFISNVPTAVLLSKFTNNYTDLLISVNI